MSFLRIENITKAYHDRLALSSINLTINKGNKVAIVGETGSGKSTLLRIIGGLEDADKGEVFYNQKKIIGPSGKLIPGHSAIVYLSQHFELPKFITVREHLDNPYLIASGDAHEIYEACQIKHLLEKDTRQLSGGEKQRVALAKALTNRPAVLLLDEPFSNLDYLHKQTIKEVLEVIERNWDTTIIMVSHEPRDVLPWADTILILKKGEVIQTDNAFMIYKRPINTYVAGLFGKYNLIDPKGWGIENQKNRSLLEGKMMVRPEELQINSLKDNGIQGKVILVKYHGNYDEITVKTATQKLAIESSPHIYRTGNEVFITVNENCVII